MVQGPGGPMMMPVPPQHQLLQRPTPLTAVSLLANAPPPSSSSSMNRRDMDEPDRVKVAKDANILLRYDMETKRLEKLIHRAMEQQKPIETIERLNQLLDMHLERGIPQI
jgi:hypothetical protein